MSEKFHMSFDKENTMLVRIMKISLLPVLILILGALSIPAFSADNATITGDGVRLRDVPATTGFIVGSVNRGTRVEVNGVTAFSETIGGDTAPWYIISHNENSVAFVYGKYVAIDEGASIPPLEEPVIYFVRTGMERFGEEESEVIKNLGEPTSVTEEECVDCFNGHYYITAIRHLTFKDVTASFEVMEHGVHHIIGIAFTTDVYSIWGLKVGDSVEEVKQVLGAPVEMTEDTLFYSNLSGWMNASFKTENGAITEIFLFTEDPG